MKIFLNKLKARKINRTTTKENRKEITSKNFLKKIIN